MIVKSDIPDDRHEKREEGKNVDSSRQWQSKPGKHGGRLLKGRSGAPGKKPDLTNPDSLVPSERNLEAESQIRDIQSALLLWQRNATRGLSLSDRAVMVFQFFITHCRRKPKEEGYLKCWHTVERIAESLCMGKRTVERAIAELKKASILLGERERFENGKFGPRFFWILTPPDLTKYAPTSANSPNRHITVAPDGAPNRHITVAPGGALLEEQRFEETSKKAEAESLRWEAGPAAPPPRGQTTVEGGGRVDDRIRRLRHRLRVFIETLIPQDHALYVWSMDPEHVQDAVREVLRGVGNGVSPVKSLLNLRRRMQVKPQESTRKMAIGCRDIFPDQTHLSSDARPGTSEPTCPICRGTQLLTTTDDALGNGSAMGRREWSDTSFSAGQTSALSPAHSSPHQTQKKLRRQLVAERMAARIERHQRQLRLILDPVLAKNHALYVWSMDPEHVSNALRAVLQGMERGESPITALAILARNGDYMSRTQQILDCRVVLGRARNSATEPGPIDWQGKESWIDDVIREAPELVYELFVRKKSVLSPGRDLYRGTVIRICVGVREKMRSERSKVAPLNHAAREVENV